MIQDAVIRNFEIIGEATKRLSAQLRAQPRVIQRMGLVEKPLRVTEHRALAYWCACCRKHHEAALPTEVLTLERLAVLAYNQKITGTPFTETHALPEPRTTVNPFQVDQALIRQIRRRIGASYAEV